MLHASANSAISQLLACQHIHLPTQGGVELHRWIIGDVGQMNDGLHAIERDGIGVAHIQLEIGELGVHRQGIAKPLGVDADHAVTISQQQGDQHGAFVAAATSNEQFHDLCW